MVKNNYFVHFVVSMVLTVLLIVAIVLQFSTGTGMAIQNLNEDETVEGKAEVFSVLDYWAGKKNEPDKYIFSLHVYNFGNAEAKNVELKCEIYVSDENGNLVNENPVTWVTKNIGNVASSSFKGAVLEMAKDSQKEGSFPAAICKINSCENCEILLERIKN